MKVACTSIRAANDKQTIATWRLPSGQELPILYDLAIADFIKQKDCMASILTVPFEDKANLAPAKANA